MSGVAIVGRTCRCLALVATAACGAPGSSVDDLWSRRAVATLGARDGYLFVFSPFNCSMREAQIDALNALASRQRRSGLILTTGHEEADSAIASRLVGDLGLRLRARPLAMTPLGQNGARAGLRAPIAIAIRGGEVVAVLSGADLDRLDGWLDWLEHRASPRL
jgi:hypothetical protein